MPAATPSAVPLNATRLASVLQEALAAPSYRPPMLPSVALEVMSLARQSDVDLAEVVKLLERDPVLAARLLALAQSAQYARRSPVMTLRQAAVRLGLEALTQMVLQAALTLRIFRPPGYAWLGRRLNRHSSAVAHVTRDLCRRASLAADHSFTVGLLHDIGLTACLGLATEQPSWSRLPFEALSPAVDAVHAHASGLIARSWGLPEPIPSILAHHHQPLVDGKPQPVNAALIVAEQLCWEAGAGMLDPPEEASPVAIGLAEPPMDGLDTTWGSAVKQALEILQLGDGTLAAARLHAFDVVDRLDVALDE